MKKKRGNVSNTQAAFWLMVITSFSLVFSFLKESVLAYFFGTTAEMDAYTMAIQLPVTLFATISVAINTVVIPNYSYELVNNGKENANKYASNLLTLFTSFSFLICLLCICFAEQIISIVAPGLAANSKAVCTLMFRIVVPTVLLTEIIQINTGILNVYRSYILPSLGIVFSNICFIVVVIALFKELGIFAAITGVIIGTLIECIFSIYIRRKHMRYKWRFDIHDKSTIKSLKMSIPVCLGIGAAEINKIVDRAIASFFESGSIAVLNYAGKLSSAVSSLMLKAITTIAYPEFAKSAAESDEKSLAYKFILSLRLYIILLLPIIVGGAFLSKDIIKVVFMRGSFDADSVLNTAPLFACYLVCLLFTAFRQAGSNYFYAQGNSSIPMRNSLIGIAANIILNIILSYFLNVFGLALATTISTCIICVLLLKDVKRNNKCIDYMQIKKVCVNSTIAAGIMLIVLSIMKRICFGLYNSISSSMFYNLLYLFCNLVIGSIVYFGVLYLFHTPEITTLFDQIRVKVIGKH